MACLLTSSLLNELSECGYTSPGISRLWLTEWSPALPGFARWSVDEEIEYLPAVQFTEISTSPNNLASQDHEIRNRRYLHSLTFTVNDLTKSKQLVKDILSKKKMVAVIENSGRKWLVGFDAGISAVGSVSGTGNESGRAGYEYILEGYSRYPFLPIADGYDPVSNEFTCDEFFQQVINTTSLVFWPPYFDCIIP